MMTTPMSHGGSTASPSVADAGSEFALTVYLYRQYQQIADFHLPGVAVLGLDECPPLGRGWGPSPVQLLGSSIGACLAGALLRAMRDAGATVVDLHTRVSGRVRIDTLGRSHVASLTVRLAPVLASRNDADALPSPERLAQLSMIADALRTDLPLWIAINPEVRSDTEVPRDAVKAGRLGFEASAPVPRFIEPLMP